MCDSTDFVRGAIVFLECHLKRLAASDPQICSIGSNPFSGQTRLAMTQDINGRCSLQSEVDRCSKKELALCGVGRIAESVAVYMPFFDIGADGYLFFSSDMTDKSICTEDLFTHATALVDTLAVLLRECANSPTTLFLQHVNQNSEVA